MQSLLKPIVPLVAMLAWVCVMATGHARAAETLDGRWEGTVTSQRCAIRGTIDVSLSNGRLSGHWDLTGARHGNGSYGVSASVDGEGRVRNGVAGGRYDILFRGELSEGEGNWTLPELGCTGRWEVKRIDPPEAADVATREPEPEPVEPELQAPTPQAPPPQAQDALPPVIGVPETLETDRASVEFTGTVSDASSIIEVRVGGNLVRLGADNRFIVRRGVREGESEIVVSALDEWGNQSSKTIRVLRRSAVTPAPEITAARKEPVATGEDREPPVIDLPVRLDTNAALVTIEGQVTDASNIVDLRLNDRPLPIGPDGRFSTQRGVPEGVSDFEIVALDEWGNRAEFRLEVNRQAQMLDFGNYHALVIGNNNYADMPVLRTAMADAEAIADTLTTRYGFNVVLLLDATRYDIIRVMSEMRASLTFNDNLLIYYAGHGIVDPVTERGYWLPVDADADNPANWVSNDDITNMLKAIPARHILVVADSCYSGTLTRQAPARLKTWQDRQAWLERLLEKRSRTVLSSGGLEPVADSGASGHSVFANALLTALRGNTEIIEATGLFEPVRQMVVLNANQTPQYSDVRLAGHEGGDFVFVPQ